MEYESENKELTLDYKFNPREIKMLAKFFRNNQDKIPYGLEEFSRALEKAVYESMSIDEVEKFYS